MSAPEGQVGQPDRAAATTGWPRLVRRTLGVLGLGMLVYGVVRVVLVAPLPDLAHLLLWLAGAVVVHDGLLSPALLALGRLLRRLPPRARRHVQGALVAAAMIVVVALPLIYLEGSQPPEKALLLQDYPANLTVLLAAVAVVALVAYGVRVARDSRGARTSAPGREPHQG